MTTRSRSGRSSSAECTRQASQDSSASSAGPARVSASLGTSTAFSRFWRGGGALGARGRGGGAAVVSELPDRHREHRTREALVELLERLPVSGADALDEAAVALRCGHGGRHTVRGYGCKGAAD